MHFSTDTRWIWLAGDVSPRNFWLRARRTFHCPADIQKATLLITADSRYELYVNERDLGNGPVRSFPWAYGYDAYDVTGWIDAGTENVLAVRVSHLGDHTFQYIRGRGGLLCELVLERADGQIERLSSDEQWLLSPDPALRRAVPRISIQQGFEEQYDARQDDSWLSRSYVAGSEWSNASVIGPVGTAPWKELVPRDIPFLTRDVVLPKKLVALELAQEPRGYRWSFDLRHRVRARGTGLRAEPAGKRGVAFATEIIVQRACHVDLVHMSGADYEWGGASCNGQITLNNENELQMLQQPGIELHEGRNLFVITGTEWPATYFITAEPLIFDATRLLGDNINVTANEAAWAYCGPFDERSPLYRELLTAPDCEHLPPVPRQAIAATENLEDIALLTRAQHFLLPAEGFCDPDITGPQPRSVLKRTLSTPLAASPNAFLHQNADYTLLYPQQEGDVHLIVDFGCEVVGFPVLEVAAQSGTIIDANFFEGVDGSGIFWTDLLRNSFRYVCREGYQVFRSHQRRGFRYAALTIRFPGDRTEQHGPLKLYNVHCLLNTYPVEQRGTFACSDALLTKIWEVAKYTVQLCMEDTYVDCPAYEQTFWVGDARNSALVNATAFGAYDLTRHCLQLVARSLSDEIKQLQAPHLQKRPHLTTDHTVSGWFSEIPMWSFLWIWNVWEHYQLTDERETLQDLYPAVRECLRRFLGFLTPRGLMDYPDVWNLLDWSATDLTRDGEVTASNALLVASLRKAASMAEALASFETADTTDATAYRTEAAAFRETAERIYAALNTYCWSEERGAYVDTLRDEQAYEIHRTLATEYGFVADERETFLSRTRYSEHTNTLVLLCECAPVDRARRILPLVEAALQGHFIGSSPAAALRWPAEKTVPVGSPWFLFFTAETLFAQKRAEAVLTLIREQWGRMLDKGATTFWETFPDLSGRHWSRSLCHGWSAAPGYFLPLLLLGVQPVEAGYTRVRIEPHIFDLHWAQGSIPTPQGDISVQWTRYDNDSVEINVALPEHVRGELVLSFATQEPLLLAGLPGDIVYDQQQWHVALQGGFSQYRMNVQDTTRM